MKGAWVAVALIGLAFLSLVTLDTGERTDLASPEDTAFLWDGLYLGKQTFAEVPYVSTPRVIVDEIIRLAGVKATDVVYDLGCGDGRLVIEAARKAGCRGVGVDIDGELVALSRRNAVAAGVDGRVRFELRDFFETDIREATVMLIFLYTHVNLRLRPKILGEMQPGSRLVSHMFDMGDWRPDYSTRVGSRPLYLWVIPANVTGTWTWEEPGSGRGVHALQVEQRYQQIRGTLSRGIVKQTLASAAVTGNRVAFTVEDGGNGDKVTREYAGTVSGDTIIGTIVSRQGARAQSVRWKAVRDAGTQRPIESGYQKTDLRWH